MIRPVHREIHFWPCATLEGRLDWSDSVEDVTHSDCREALTGDGGDLASSREPPDSMADQPAP